jgi:hypothetical protein
MIDPQANSMPASCTPYIHCVSQDLTNKRKLKIPESEYKDGPEGLK